MEIKLKIVQPTLENGIDAQCLRIWKIGAKTGFIFTIKIFRSIFPIELTNNSIDNTYQ